MTAASRTVIPFSKYHGLGNDFVVIDALHTPALLRKDWHTLSRAMCDRRLGIGADELLLLSASRTHDVTMRVFNADGTDGGMCGNGIRCIARHMVEHHAFKRDILRVDVWGVGDRPVRIHREKARFAAAEVDMGEPAFTPASVPFAASLANTKLHDQPAAINAPLPAAIRKQLGSVARSLTTMTCVSMGNPHAVLWCANPTRELVEIAGPVLQKARAFPKSVNVHVAAIQSRSHATMWTYERGAGVTLACGTGACAVLVAGVLTKKLSREATISVPGGDLRVRWDAATNRVFKTGPGAFVFAGEYAA